jgi:hypothetical protein
LSPCQAPSDDVSMALVFITIILAIATIYKGNENKLVKRTINEVKNFLC